MKNKKGLKKRYVFFIAIAALLIGLRLALPYIVKRYANNVLSDIPGYRGKIEDIDIALYRGAYVIHELELNKLEAGSQIPFLDFKKTDISIEWKSLFDGSIVSEIILTQPKIKYVFEDHKNADQTKQDDWTKALTDLVPISINRLSIKNGEIGLVDLSVSSKVDLGIHQLNLEVSNLRNVVEKEKRLPSYLNATAVSIGNGKVELKGGLNLLKEIPDMDISFKLENASTASFNQFSKHYTNLNFEKGTLSVYSEMAIAEGFLTGYVKPILNNIKMEAGESGFLNKLWEGLANFTKFILKNQSTNNVATKVPLEGDLSNVETGVWLTIVNIFKNAWIKAFERSIDNEVEFKDALKKSHNENK